MKKVFFLQLLAAALLLNACHKEDEPISSNPGETKTKLLTGLRYSQEKFQPLDLDYDSKGRVKLVEDNEDRDTYEFRGDSVFIKEFRKTDNRYVFDFKGKMDAKGRVISGKASVSYLVHAPYTATYSFEYDAQGYQTKEICLRSDNQNYEYRYEHENGDLVKQRAYLNGQLEYGADYTYYPDLPNNSGIEFNKFYSCPNGLSGTPSQHLMKSATGINSEGQSGWHFEYSYQMGIDKYPVSADIQSTSWGNYQMFYQYR